MKATQTKADARGALTAQPPLTRREFQNRQPDTGADNAGDWLRLPKPKQRLWGLSRTTWNELTDSGQVKSITLRKKHAQRGIKLIFRPSAEAYLKSLMADDSREVAQ